MRVQIRGLRSAARRERFPLPKNNTLIIFAIVYFPGFEDSIPLLVGFAYKFEKEEHISYHEKFILALVNLAGEC